MNEHIAPQETEQETYVSKHRYVLMISSAILIALALTGLGLVLYKMSGAEQLDLSRPGYDMVRESATTDEKFDSFSSTGPIDEKALDEFRKLYDQQANKATAVDSFGGDALSDESLQIETPTP